MIILVLLFLLLSTSAQQPAPYQQTAKWTIGGEGGWDYLMIDDTGHRLFVAHGTKYEAIDLHSGKKVGELPAEGAHGLVVVPDKKLGVSANGRAGTVTVFDSESLKPLRDIKVGSFPDTVIYDSHSQRVLVMNHGSHDMMVLDPALEKVEATVPLGGELEFAVTDDHNVYINIADTAEIAVLKLGTWTPVARWKLPGCEDPSGLAIDQQNHHLFTACGNKVMLVVEAKSGTSLASLPTGAGTDGAGFDPGFHYAFASNGEGTLTVIRAEADRYEVAANIPTARGARTMTVDPATHNVYLATAELGPPPEGQKRPSVKPGTFAILVYSPTK